MKDEDPPGVRRDAMLSLYGKLKRTEAARDRRSAEIADHALTLALSDKRQPSCSAYLARDTVRDARRIYSRRRDPLRHAKQLDGDPGQEVLAGASLVDAPPRPDQIAEERELLARITTAAATVPFGHGCLEGIALGESVDESAARLGLSPRQVRYVRQLVREMALLVSGQLR